MASGTRHLVNTAAGPTHAAIDAAASGDTRTVFICAHGAGGHMDDGALAALSGALTPLGLTVVRFNFPYREQKSGRPDPMPRLIACLTGVVEFVRGRLDVERVIVGGRSMGGRAASMFAAEGGACDGVLLMAYPLHPPGRPRDLRVSHLSRIPVPVLCFNGTRDPFCGRALMEAAVGPLAPRWTMHWLEGADHSFHVLKRSGRTDRDVLDEVAAVTGGWIISSGLRQEA
jgi:predicted alpha/beta-hydrolase family hydrolase